MVDVPKQFAKEASGFTPAEVPLAIGLVDGPWWIS